jgi:hypothetical protein
MENVELRRKQETKIEESGRIFGLFIQNKPNFQRFLCKTKPIYGIHWS